MRKVRVNITISPAAYDYVKEYSRSCGCSVSEYLQTLIYLDEGKLARDLRHFYRPSHDTEVMANA